MGSTSKSAIARYRPGDKCAHDRSLNLSGRPACTAASIASNFTLCRVPVSSITSHSCYDYQQVFLTLNTPIIQRVFWRTVFFVLKRSSSRHHAQRSVVSWSSIGLITSFLDSHFCLSSKITFSQTISLVSLSHVLVTDKCCYLSLSRHEKIGFACGRP